MQNDWQKTQQVRTSRPSLSLPLPESAAIALSLLPPFPPSLPSLTIHSAAAQWHLRSHVSGRRGSGVMRPWTVWAAVFFLHFDTLGGVARVWDSNDMDALDVLPWSQTGWIILLVRHHTWVPVGHHPSNAGVRQRSPSRCSKQQMWVALSADAKLWRGADLWSRKSPVILLTVKPPHYHLYHHLAAPHGDAGQLAKQVA